MGAFLSTLTSATTLRGLSSLSERTSPIRTPSKFTLPPRRRPLAEPPSNTMRIGLSCEMVWIFRAPRKPTSPIARIATVVVPIMRLLERVFIWETGFRSSKKSKIAWIPRLYGQSGRGERPDTGSLTNVTRLHLRRQRRRIGRKRDHVVMRELFDHGQHL